MTRGGEDQTRTKIPVRQVQIRNFLSLQDVDVKLGKLNVLVGPNGGGKSNFLSVFRFLGEVARTDLVPALIHLFGGYDQVLCRVESAQSRTGIRIAIKGEITQYSSPTALDEYSLRFRPARISREQFGVQRVEELLLKRSAGRGRRISLRGDKLELETVGPRRGRSVGEESFGTIGSDSSALSVLRRIGVKNDTQQVAQLAEIFEDLRLFDPDVQAARGSSPAVERARLNPSASNLAAVLLHLRGSEPDVLEAIQDDVRYVLPGFMSFKFSRMRGDAEAIRLGIEERHMRDITPITAASFGTVRSIALFTMLRDPKPPRLTCLEEVDHGLHPHALDVLVERLRDAASRSQIIVATHSPALVNRLAPEELMVFERNAESGKTEVPEIDVEEIAEMERASDLRLGELWYSGLIGGNNR